MFSFDSQFRKNANKLLDRCLMYANMYEEFNTKPSCIPDLQESISQQIKAAKNEIREWQDYDTNYDEIAHTMLAHTTFDLLASGRYHLYAGILNPMNCSSNLMSVYKKVMEYGVVHNMITEEVKEEQYQYLIRCIKSVG